ncbi:hypothetical protein PV327_006631 [Microctonus hyperodae]|uniref:MIT domain-containing protein n=1 Tax=Microctonus hyperodae TaxID=165561 RepID=A0AA39F4N5_MICHY|nr:hypothetical protein PV327_006631 [Microctonus hyperodae]
MERGADLILKRAVDMDKKQQYTLAFVLYQEGLQILVDPLQATKDQNEKECLRTKTKAYMLRAEKIKKIIDEAKATGDYREQTKIEAGSIGNGYASVFGRFLDHSVVHIIIEDPYVRLHHQCLNLVRFCELAVQKCQKLSKVSLVTTRDPDDGKNQIIRLEELKQSLNSRSIIFEVKFSETLHDRQITLSNGWVIKIGRGLDYFKPPEKKFILGACDLELRPCLETTVDIFHRSQLK